jgi:hypothetical protein
MHANPKIAVNCVRVLVDLFAQIGVVRGIKHENPLALNAHCDELVADGGPVARGNYNAVELQVADPLRSIHRLTVNNGPVPARVVVEEANNLYFGRENAEKIA